MSFATHLFYSRPISFWKMKSAVDSAVLKALGLDENQTSISSHGGSGFSSTFKLSSVVNGEPINYFVKTGSGENAETMFKGRAP